MYHSNFSRVHWTIYSISFSCLTPSPAQVRSIKTRVKSCVQVFSWSSSSASECSCWTLHLQLHKNPMTAFNCYSFLMYWTSYITYCCIIWCICLSVLWHGWWMSVRKRLNINEVHACVCVSVWYRGRLKDFSVFIPVCLSVFLYNHIHFCWFCGL